MSTEWIEDYAEVHYAALADRAAAALGLGVGGGMTMMRSQMALSNLVFDAITSSPTGTVLEIGHPDTFTDRVEIYTSTNLVASIWTVAVTNLATNGTGTIYWTDTSATNTTAAIRFYVPGASPVRLAIYDVSGQEIRTLCSSDNTPAGTHTVTWNGSDRHGRPVARGVYVCRLETNAGTSSAKLVKLE